MDTAKTVRPKIVFYDASPTDHAVFPQKLESDFEVVTVPDALSGANLDQARDAQVISVFVSSAVPAAVMEQLPELKHIACRSTGFDKVDLPAARSRGITVSTVPTYGEETVAEYAFLLLLAVARRLMLTAHAARFGVSSAEKLTGTDLYGKTLGVVGTGRIGRHAARLGKGFGMNVIAYDVYPVPVEADQIGYEYVPLPELLSRSDAITLHAPATPETEHLLNQEALKAVKPGVMIVNTARGSLIDTPALIAALKSGQVGGAGLDVLEGEELLGKSHSDADKSPRQQAIDELGKMPNVLITMHNAYNSFEALGRIREATVANILAWHAGRPENLVK